MRVKKKSWFQSFTPHATCAYIYTKACSYYPSSPAVFQFILLREKSVRRLAPLRRWTGWLFLSLSLLPQMLLVKRARPFSISPHFWQDNASIQDVYQLNSVDGATYQSLYCPNTEWCSLGWLNGLLKGRENPTLSIGTVRWLRWLQTENTTYSNRVFTTDNLYPPIFPSSSSDFVIVSR